MADEPAITTFRVWACACGIMPTTAANITAANIDFIRNIVESFRKLLGMVDPTAQDGGIMAPGNCTAHEPADLSTDALCLICKCK